MKLGQRDLDDLGAGGREQLDRLVEACLDAGLEALAAELADDADPQSRDVGAPGGRDDGGHGVVDATWSPSGRVRR